jgi:GT2 family glycosyltransferase
MLLSFIIPAHNEEHELGGAIDSVRHAAAAVPHEHEIVVADDASTDRTADIARAAGAKVVCIGSRQIAAARNAGAREGRGDVLFFVDADTHIAPAHVTGAIAALQNGFAGGGALVAVRDPMPFWARIFTRIFCRLYFAANLGAGAFLFTTRGNFEAIGGFDERYFAGEEVFFTKALKQLGRFRLLSEPVLTSGRKLRMHSGSKVLMSIFLLIIAGPRALATRAKLDFWYDGKREGTT